MAEFAYRAADPSGATRNGSLQAPSRDAALRQLRAQGLTPLRLVEAAAGAPAAPPSAAAPSAAAPPAGAGARVWRGRDRGPNAADVHHLTSELAVMLRAGLSLDRALRVQVGMSAKPSLTALFEEILRAVKSGSGLSQALAARRALFGDFYINMVRSGEAGGHLGEVMERLAEHLERLRALRESVISALIYPAILVAVAVVAVALMLGFVVPQFETLFADLGEGLPLPTRMIVGLGHLIADWGWLLALLVAAGIWLARRRLATDAGRAWRDARLLRLPVFGDIVRKYELTRFARSLGTLLGNGVPIVTAVGIARDTMGNDRLRAAMDEVAPAIKQGGRLADALEKTGLFTPLGLNMVRLGEETGALDAMLLELARVHDGEVQAGVKRALTLVEPLLILTLGAVIAAIIVSILMGILAVNELAI